MLTYVSEVQETITLFTVLKKVVKVDGQEFHSSRLVWDDRRMNCRFKEAPWVPLGSPAMVSHVELSDDILEGRAPWTFQGDVPQFFYRLRCPDALAPFSVVDGITPAQLFAFSEKHGGPVPPPPLHARGIACKVLTMGWKWAVFCAHSTLQDAFGMEFNGPECGRVQHGSPVLSFDVKQLIYTGSTSTTTLAECSITRTPRCPASSQKATRPALDDGYKTSAWERTRSSSASGSRSAWASRSMHAPASAE